MINIAPSTIVVFGLLTAATIFIWSPVPFLRKPLLPVWMVLWGLSAVTGVYFGIIMITGIIYLIILGLFCYLSTTRSVHPAYQIIVNLVIVLMVAALFLHAVPGFNNPRVFDQFQKGVDSTIYTQYWNFDKASAGLLLLAFIGDRCKIRQEWFGMFKSGIWIIVTTVSISIVLAMLFGYIAWAPAFGLPVLAWGWANLFFTCVAEEMLFRGVIQRQLLRIVTNDQYRVLTVILVGILFGLAHYAGGTLYVILAAIAGTGYGYVYYRTRRIESAILTHFLLNAVHFVFFTYPYQIGAMGQRLV
jgi:hypothetical protein